MTLIPVHSPYFVGWKIGQAEYTGNSVAISEVRSIDFKPDGSSFVALLENGTLQLYTCAAPFDLSTASAGSTISITYNSTLDIFFDVQFSDDGNKIFVLGQKDGGGGEPDYLEEHSLSSAYGGIATYTVRTTGPFNFDNFAFTPDGTRIIGTHDGEIYDATLSTGFDLSTISAWSSRYVDFGANQFRGITWGGRNNEQFVFYNYSTNRVYYATLATPEDISTATYTIDGGLIASGNGRWDMVYADQGKKLYAVGTNTVYEYNTLG